MLKATLQAWLSSLDVLPKRIWIAYSGGPDSHALLHALASLNTAVPIAAAHVNHQLSPQSTDWVQHCHRICQQLNIVFEIHTLPTAPPKGESVEAWARKQRYDWFKSILNEGEVLCTAHSQDDQIETLLLNLFRGASLGGLSGIASTRALGAGQVMRPLLNIDKATIYDYLKQHQQDYVLDESNLSNRYDRNFIRNETLPHLKARFTGIEQRLLRTVRHCQQSRALIDEIALQDLAHCQIAPQQLVVSSLKSFTTFRQHNVIKSWLKQQVDSLPSDAKIETLLAQLGSSADAHPQIEWHDWLLYRYQDTLNLTKVPITALKASLDWDCTEPLRFNGQIWIAKQVKGEGLDIAKLGARRLDARLRTGGERCCPYKRTTRPLKKWLQDYHVSPTERARLPLFYVEDELVAVGALFVTQEWAVTSSIQYGLIFEEVKKLK